MTRPYSIHWEGVRIGILENRHGTEDKSPSPKLEEEATFNTLLEKITGLKLEILLKAKLIGIGDMLT